MCNNFFQMTGLRMIKLVLTVFVFFLFGLNHIFGQMKIGIALPMMNSSEGISEKSMGVQMLRGINDALEEYNSKNPGQKISIKVEDTKKDPAVTLQCINKFGSDSSVIAILGPVYSSELVNNVGAAKFHKIPVITPTATQNKLASNNEFVFQLNPTYDIRG